MPETYKILGQLALGATTEGTLYTVPAATSAVVSSIVIGNRDAATTFRVYVSVAGEATANKQYLAYNAPIDANDSVTLTLGITLATTDVIRVYAGSANLSFNAFGTEIT